MSTDTPAPDFSGLRATYVNCTLKKSPEPSHTQGLVDASAAIMRKHGVEVEVIDLRSLWPYDKDAIFRSVEKTNRAMIERSRRLIVCVDSSKWGVVGLSSMAGLSEAAVLVTDSGLPAQASGALADHVGELVVVDPVDDLDEAEDL